MAGLDELRKRVEAAESHFGLMSTQSRKYSERLTRLVSQMEQAHAGQHQEIAQLSGRLGQLEQENSQLKSMLMGLLQAIENGSDRVIDHAVRDLEGRIGRLVGTHAESEPVADAGLPEPAPALPEAETLDDDLGDAVAFDAGDCVDAVDTDDFTAAVAGAAPRPEPETVALDDYPEQNGSLADSANDLLDRVEAAANALLAAGMAAGDSEDDTELSDEISALLASAISGEPVIDADGTGPDAADDEDISVTDPGLEVEAGQAAA